MNTMEMVRKLRSINYALERVEVRGRENLDILLGSMQEIDRIAIALEKSLKEQNPSPQPEVVVEAVEQ